MEHTHACCVPVSPLRIEPAHRTEMVTQQLFGETCMIIDFGDDIWVKIKCSYDGYEGWCQQSHLCRINNDGDSTSNELTADYLGEIDFNGTVMHIPMGCSLKTFKHGRAKWEENLVVFNGNRFTPGRLSNKEETIRKISNSFLNTAYLWGGKSIFGIDCSGFTQTVFKFLNIPLLRDAWQQASQGECVESIDLAQAGDLAFFDNESGRITHVGIMLDNLQIIHSSGKVRIDQMDALGIVNADTKARTHRLKTIRRYF